MFRSDDSDYVHHLSNPKETLVERNYFHDTLNKAYNEACKSDRKLALARRDPKAHLRAPKQMISSISIIQY